MSSSPKKRPLGIVKAKYLLWADPQIKSNKKKRIESKSKQRQSSENFYRCRQLLSIISSRNTFTYNCLGNSNYQKNSKHELSLSLLQEDGNRYICYAK